MQIEQYEKAEEAQPEMRDEGRIVEDLRAMTGKELSLLRYRSHYMRIYAMVLPFLFGAICYFMFIVKNENDRYSEYNVLYLGNIPLIIVALYAAIFRTRASRVYYFVASIAVMIQFPIGTFVGAVALYFIIGTERLWGINRITHKQVEAEFSYRVGKYGYGPAD